MLVVYDLQLRALASQAEDGRDKVGPAHSEQPLRANDQVCLW